MLCHVTTGTCSLFQEAHHHRTLTLTALHPDVGTMMTVLLMGMPLQVALHSAPQVQIRVVTGPRQEVVPHLAWEMVQESTTGGGQLHSTAIIAHHQLPHVPHLLNHVILPTDPPQGVDGIVMGAAPRSEGATLTARDLEAEWELEPGLQVPQHPAHL